MYNEHLGAGLNTFSVVGLLLSHFVDRKPEMRRLSNFSKIKRVVNTPEKSVVMGIYFAIAHVDPKWEKNSRNL